MYSIFIDIPGFRQARRILPETINVLVEKIQVLTRDSGAELNEIYPGRWLSVFTNLRPGDYQFLLDNFIRYITLLTGYSEFITGYTLILELTNNNQNAETVFGKLLLSARRSEGAWLGKTAAQDLADYTVLEREGDLWKFLGIQSRQSSSIRSPMHILESIQPVHKIADSCGLYIKSSPCVLVIEADRPWWIGTYAERLIQTLCSDPDYTDYIWIRGTGNDDNPWACLSRTLFHGLLRYVSSNINPEDADEWIRLCPYLSSYDINPTRISRTEQNIDEVKYYWPFFIKKAWQLFFKHWLIMNKKKKRPAVLFLENIQAMPEELQFFLLDFLGKNAKLIENNFLLVVTEVPEPFLRTLPSSWYQRHEFLPPVSNSPFSVLPIDAHTAAIQEYVQASSIDSLLAQLEETERELLYEIYLSNSLITLSSLAESLVIAGIERIRIPQLLIRLYQLGLIRHKSIPIPVCNGITDHIEPFLKERAQSLKNSFIEFIQAQISPNSGFLALDLFIACRDFYPDKQYVAWGLTLGDNFLDHGMAHDTTRVLDQLCIRSAASSDAEIHNLYENLIQYFQFRLKLYKSKASEVSSNSRDFNLSVAINTFLEPFLLLQSVRLLICEGDYEQATHMIKKTIIAFQDTKHVQGLANSHILFGLILMGKEKLLEAREYYHLARVESGKHRKKRHELCARLLELCTQFLQGAYSSTLQALEGPNGLLQETEKTGMLDLTFLARFLLARLLFEFGKYSEAIQAFANLTTNIEDINAKHLLGGLYAWQIQCLLLQENVFEAQRLIQELLDKNFPFDKDLILIQAECYVQTGNYNEALELLSIKHTKLHIHPEHLLPNSLLFYPEQYLFAGNDRYHSFEIRQDMIKANAYKGLGDSKAAIMIYAEKARSKQFSNFDPSLHIYLHHYSQVLRETREKFSDDGVTILGKAIKYLQERGSRIENPLLKLQFTKSNIKNQQLLTDAKKYNLV